MGNSQHKQMQHDSGSGRKWFVFSRRRQNHESRETLQAVQPDATETPTSVQESVSLPVTPAFQLYYERGRHKPNRRLAHSVPRPAGASNQTKKKQRATGGTRKKPSEMITESSSLESSSSRLGSSLESLLRPSRATTAEPSIYSLLKPVLEPSERLPRRPYSPRRQLPTPPPILPDWGQRYMMNRAYFNSSPIIPRRLPPTPDEPNIAQGHGGNASRRLNGSRERVSTPGRRAGFRPPTPRRRY